MTFLKTTRKNKKTLDFSNLIVLEDPDNPGTVERTANVKTSSGKGKQERVYREKSKRKEKERVKGGEKQHHDTMINPPS